MDLKKRPYKKDFNYSYTLGVFPTLELIKYRPANLIKVVTSSMSDRNEGVNKIKIFCQKNKVNTEVNDGLLKGLSGSDNTYALGVFTKFESQIDPKASHLVLVNPGDAGNLGTIIRTMVGFGLKDLALIRPAVDIFDPKTIRASMGAVFQINFEYFGSFSGYEKKHDHNKYTFLTNGMSTIDDITFKEPFSLIFGSESSGLDKEFEKIGQSVKIPQTKNVDSLNLPIAVGIALYKAFNK